jgi:LEA14-like dessication related protein
MQTIRYTIFIFAALAFAGCADFNDVSINIDGSNMKINSVKGSRFKLNIPVEIDNPTTKKLLLKKINFDVRKNGYNFAKLEMNESVEIANNTKEKYTVVLNGKIVDPAGMIFSGFSFKNTSSENYTLNGFVKAGTKIFSKKIKFKNADFSTLINSFEKTEHK